MCEKKTEQVKVHMAPSLFDAIAREAARQDRTVSELMGLMAKVYMFGHCVPEPLTFEGANRGEEGRN